MDNQSPKLVTWLLAVATAAVLLSVSGLQGHLERLAQRGMTPAAPPAAAPGVEYTECFAAKLWTGEGAAVSAGDIPKTVKVPPGWTVVGGTTASAVVGMAVWAAPAMVLCRTGQPSPLVAPPFPSAKRVVPAGPAVAQGRCSAPEVDEMQQAGMSGSAIERACKP
jgi:hypothetical protein